MLPQKRFIKPRCRKHPYASEVHGKHHQRGDNSLNGKKSSQPAKKITMTSYFVTAGCGEEEKDISKEIVEPDKVGDKTDTAEEIPARLRGCFKDPESKHVMKVPLKEEDLRDILSRRLELARKREKEAMVKGVLKGRMAYLKTTHYNSNWRETGKLFY